MKVKMASGETNARNSSLLEAIKKCPEDVVWSQAHECVIEKTKDGNLGFTLDTLKVAGCKETFTIVVNVQPKCNIQDRNILDTTFRIRKIGKKDIISLNRKEVIKLLDSAKQKKSKITLSLSKLIGYRNNKAREITRNHVIANEKLGSLDVVATTGYKLHDFNHNNKTAAFHHKTTRLDSCVEDLHNTKTTAGVPAAGGITATLTPVESPDIVFDFDENTPLMEEFSEIGKKPDAESFENEVISVALNSPAKIIWDDKILKFELEKKNNVFGFHYKIKIARDESEMYMIVDDVHSKSPADGKLRKGDWIRSINQWPITKDKDKLKSLLDKNRSLSIVLQRPKNILTFRKANNSTMSSSSVKSRTNSNPSTSEELLIPTSPSTTLSSPRSIQSLLPPDYHKRLELDDIKIDGMSVYNGIVSLEENYKARPVEVCNSGMSNYSNLPTFLEGKQTIKDVTANNAIKLEKVSENINGGDNQHQAGYFNGTGGAEDLDTVIAESVKKVLNSELPKIPFVRINIISTDNTQQFHFMNKMLEVFNVKKDDQLSSRHVCKVEPSTGALTAVGCQDKGDAASSTHIVENLILAKNIANELCSNSVFSQIKDKRERLCSRTNHVICGVSYEDIAHLIDDFSDASYLELEVKNYTFNDINNFWPSVYFTPNSIFVIVFNSEQYWNNPVEEHERILTCMNHIRSSCANTPIYLTTNKPKHAKLPEIVEKFKVLNRISKANEDIIGSCSQCSCDKKSVIPAPSKQVQVNGKTSHCWFFVDKDSDFNEFTSNIKNDIINRNYMTSKFPVLGLVILNELTKSGLKFSARSSLIPDLHLQHLLPKATDSSKDLLNYILGVMHLCGKIVDYRQVPHRTSNNQALEQLVCHDPNVVKDAFRSVSLKKKLTDIPRQSIVASSSTAQTDYNINQLRLKELLGEDCHEIVAFLELYHILEPRDKESHDYYFIPSLISNHMNRKFSLTKTQNYASDFRNDDRMEKLYVDFHGFLPINMCTSILCHLEAKIEKNKSQIDIIDAFTAKFMHQGVEFLLVMEPENSMAEVTVKLNSFSPQEFYKFLKFEFSSAVMNNILIFHIGPRIELHIAEQSSKYHIIDLEVSRSVSSNDQHIQMWKPEAWAAVTLLTPNTKIAEMPRELLALVCNRLNEGNNWKNLYGILLKGSHSQLQLFERSENPCSQVLSEAVKKGQISTVTELFTVIFYEMKREDIEGEVTKWMSTNGVRNWLHNGRT